MTVLSGHILTPGGWLAGTLQFDAYGRIAAVEGAAVEEAQVRASALPMLIPGFVDLHVHGGGGQDIMQGGTAAHHVAALHARFGTTAMLATTMTAPFEDLRQAFTGLAPSLVAPRGEGARVLGVHLEGPYINEGKLGAQPAYARPLQSDELAALHALAAIRLVTLAPEVPGNMQAIGALVAAGLRVQIGHSLASYEQSAEALARGATGFTHLFNAMSPLHHREPGAVGAALAHAQFAEIIPDLIHVHAGAIRVALRAIPHLYCVTDSTAAAGMPDGDYRLGRHMVTKCLGGVRLPDGTLAGSTLTMDHAFRNLVLSLGLSLQEASLRTSTFAADHMGVLDRGRLVPRAWADVLVLGPDLQLQAIYTEGSRLEPAHPEQP